MPTDEEFNDTLNKRISDVEFQWRNYHIRFFSMDTRTILLGFLILACTGYIALQWWEDRHEMAESKKEYLTAHKLTQTLISNLIDNQKTTNLVLQESQVQSARLAESVNDTSYILTLTQQKREDLKLEMPQSLRKKLNER